MQKRVGVILHGSLKGSVTEFPSDRLMAAKFVMPEGMLNICAKQGGCREEEKKAARVPLESNKSNEKLDVNGR